MAVGQNDAHPERSPIDGGEWRMEKTTCQVCMHHCSLAPGQIGLCGARKMRAERLSVRIMDRLRLSH